jgi:hypothetical protein
MMVETNNILIALGALAFGIYFTLLVSSFLRHQLNGFKASLSFSMIVIGLVCFMRITEEQVIPLFYGQVLTYVAFMLNAYTFYRAMNPVEFKEEVKTS